MALSELQALILSIRYADMFEWEDVIPSNPDGFGHAIVMTLQLTHSNHSLHILAVLTTIA